MVKFGKIIIFTSLTASALYGFFAWNEGTLIDYTVPPLDPQNEVIYLIEERPKSDFGTLDDWRLIGRFKASEKSISFVNKGALARNITARMNDDDPLGLYVAYLVHDRKMLGFDDPVKARTLLKRAANAGHVTSQFNLGRDYLLGGKSVTKDPSRAEVWLRRAAENGHAQAAELLSINLGTGRNGLKKNCLEALNYANETLEAYKRQQTIFVHTAWLLGSLHSRDCQSLKADPKTAIYWLEIAATQDEQFHAAAYLGGLYERHESYYDLEKAAYWYQYASRDSELARKGLKRMKAQR